MKSVTVAIIGGGLMGRELATAIGRWPALLDLPVRLELTAVCDVVEKTREWFRQIPTVTLLTSDGTVRPGAVSIQPKRRSSLSICVRTDT